MCVIVIYVVVHAEFKNLKEENHRIEIYDKIDSIGWVKIVTDRNSISTTWLQCFNVTELNKEICAKFIHRSEEDFKKCSEEYTKDIVIIASVSEYGVGIEPKPQNVDEIIKHVKGVGNKRL